MVDLFHERSCICSGSSAIRVRSYVRFSWMKEVNEDVSDPDLVKVGMRMYDEGTEQPLVYFRL